jgi:hypothetical protein
MPIEPIQGNLKYAIVWIIITTLKGQPVNGYRSLSEKRHWATTNLLMSAQDHVTAANPGIPMAQWFKNTLRTRG